MSVSIYLATMREPGVVSFDEDALGLSEVNMCNANAHHILTLLGVTPGEDMCGVLDAEDFLGRVLIAQAVAPSDAGTPTHQDARMGTLIHGGRPAGYTERVLGELRIIAETAHRNGKVVAWS